MRGVGREPRVKLSSVRAPRSIAFRWRRHRVPSTPCYASVQAPRAYLERRIPAPAMILEPIDGGGRHARGHEARRDRGRGGAGRRRPGHALPDRQQSRGCHPWACFPGRRSSAKATGGGSALPTTSPSTSVSPRTGRSAPQHASTRPRVVARVSAPDADHDDQHHDHHLDPAVRGHRGAASRPRVAWAWRTALGPCPTSASRITGSMPSA
jgi:hypothetical protein